MITKSGLLAWREEVDIKYDAKSIELKERIEKEDPIDMGLQMSRLELVAEMRALEQVSICLGQVLRGKRL